MGKCSRCGRKGLFLRLTNGLCENCQATIRAEEEQAAIKARGEAEQAQIQSQINELSRLLADQDSLYRQIKERAIQDAQEEFLQKKDELEQQITFLQGEVEHTNKHLAELTSQEEKSEKNAASSVRKLQKLRESLRAAQHVIKSYESDELPAELDATLSQVEDLLRPTVVLNLNCLDMRELRKRYRQNEKNIQATLEKYASRYTTKANIAIYRLMVIALAAELQNVLHSLGYGRLDDALSNINTITAKYLKIATEGNQSIAPTMKKFIGEIDYYYKEAVHIEYEYYVQKERAKEEQRALREQMRQEAEERRQLEQQRKQIEKEESKYHDQIAQVTEQLAASQDDEKIRQLEARLAELQQQLTSVAEKREEIVHLQNGKAGHVYIISNIGSFGDDVFKVGMTRRLDPQDRVNELGDASVPFPFDVHSFIFSDDAVSLENQLHKTLNDRRVNKVNLRKEFFRVSLDELEELVNQIAPTAEFKRTILAEQYRQSLSIDHIEEIIPSSDESEMDEE